MSNSAIRIPGYEIIREIGRGGIATVYLAVQESLEREVALKVMSPVLVAEPNFTERFIAEGRTIAQLNHPGIVTIYDIAAENYYTYIAMEYLPGGSLREKLRDKLSEKSVLGIVYQMADALACAHDSGIVHRDVKPENIMFRANGSPVLTDFGIAKTVGSDARLTQSGIIVGTPRYISPEQADGRGTDQRSDLYALGVILYEMLAGKPPYGKGSDDSISLLYSHVHDPIPELPEEHRHLQYLVNATMAKDPDKRVSDCHKLADMVRVIRREVRRGGALKHADESARAPRTAEGRDGAAVSSGRRSRSRMTWRWVLGGFAALVALLTIAAMLGDWTAWRGAGPDIVSTGVSESRTASPSLLQETPPSPRTVDTRPLETVAAADATVGAVPTPATPPPQREAEEAASPTVVDEERAEDNSGVDGSGDSRPHTRAAADATVGAVPTPATPPPQREAEEAVSPTVVDEEPAEDSSRVDGAGDSRPQARADAAARVPESEIAVTKKTPRARVSSPRRLALQPMLQLAKKQMQLGQIDAPEGDNALETYRRVLSEDKNNAEARAGLNEIADHFLDRGRESAEAMDYEEAKAFVARGLKAIPEHETMRNFHNEITLRLEAEREFEQAEDYYWGRSGERDLEAAVRSYRGAAEKGHVLAQYFLGVAYADGTGTTVDEAEALRWLRRAAVQGNEDAQFNLALGLIFSADPDPTAAAELMTALAERNYEPAFQILGWMFNTGTGVKQSIKEAIRWDFKDVVTEPRADSSLPKRSVASWQRLLDAAIQQTQREQVPQEPR